MPPHKKRNKERVTIVIEIDSDSAYHSAVGTASLIDLLEGNGYGIKVIKIK